MSKFDNDTLLCLFLHGPTYDGDVPSKSERDELHEAGLIARGKGFQWLTDAGVIHCLSLGYEAKQRKHQRLRRERGEDAERYQFLRARLLSISFASGRDLSNQSHLTPCFEVNRDEWWDTVIDAERAVPDASAGQS